MRSFTQLCLSLLVAVCLVGLVGCQDSGGSKTTKTDSAHDDDHAHDGDHDHADHQHADNYDDAVAELVELQVTIKDGFANDTFQDAHEPLHEVAHVLENLETFVKNSDMDEAAKKSCGDAIENLFAAYGAVDDKQHGSGGKDYEEVSEQIELSIKTLQDNVTKKAGE